VDPGFQARSALTFDVNLPGSRYAELHRVRSFYDDLTATLSRHAGVTAAGAVEFMPLSGADSAAGVFAAERPMPKANEEPRAHYRSVTPAYFRAIGLPLRAGRVFTAADRHDAPRVAIVNETLARQLWPGESPIGKRLALAIESLRFFRDRAPELDLPSGMRDVVGVVADVKHAGLDGTPPPEMYIPFDQRPSRDMTVVVSATSDLAGLAASLRREIAKLDPEQPIANVRTLDQLLDASLAQPRFNSVLVGAFATLALVLTAVGIYGVLGFIVSQRTRESGVRLALGAAPADIVRLVITRGIRLALPGILIGLVGSLLVSTALARVLFSVTTGDPCTYAGSAALVLVVSFIACYLPARRAAHVDPVVALRCD
jgi:putative ABC transport system permease protein